MVPATPPPSRATGIAARALQAGLAALVLLAPGANELNNLRFYGLLIAVAPDALRVLFGTRPRPIQRVWIAAAVALHPIGGLYDVYRTVWWYDHLSHAASATLIAGLGYAAVRAAGPDDARVPAAGHAVALLVVVLSGEIWEVYELHVSYLTVYGPDDTVADLAFDVVGWGLMTRGHRLLVRPLAVSPVARVVNAVAAVVEDATAATIR